MNDSSPESGLNAWEALGVIVGSVVLTSFLAFALGIHWWGSRRVAAWQCVAIGLVVGVVFWSLWFFAVFGG